MLTRLVLIEVGANGYTREYTGEIETEPNDGEFELTLTSPDNGAVDATILVERAMPVAWKYAEDDDLSYKQIAPTRAAARLGPAFVDYEVMLVA